MSYRYEIDSERQLITAVIEGGTTPDDFAELLRAYRADPDYDARYDRLWDGRAIRSLAMDSAGLQHLSAAVYAMQPQPLSARIAVVVQIDFYHDVSLFVKMMARVGDIRVFLWHNNK